MLRQHQDIEHLTKALMSSCDHQIHLQTGNLRINQNRLSTPISLAWIIDAYAIPMPSERPLRILLVGCEDAELVDEGAWFAMMPAILGCAFNYELVMSSFGDNVIHVNSRAPASLKRAEHFTGSLADCVDQFGPNFDLVVMFHPGYEKHHREWFDKQNSLALKHLLQHGIPVVMTSFDRTEMKLDQEFAEAYGFGIDSIKDNPFKYDPTEGETTLPVDFAACAGRFTDKVPSENFEPDEETLNNITLDIDISMEDFLVQTAKKFFARGDDPQKIFISMAGIVSQCKNPDDVVRMLHEDENFVDLVRAIMDEAYNAYMQENMSAAIDEVFAASGVDNPEAIAQLKKMMMGNSSEDKSRLSETEDDFFNAIVEDDFNLFLAMVEANPDLIHALDDEEANAWSYLGYSATPQQYAELLSANGVDIHQRDEEGWSPLIYAITRNNRPLVEMLLGYGADPNLPTYRNHYPVVMAVLNGGAEMIPLLENAGADLTLPSHVGIPLSEFIEEVLNDA